MMVHVVNLRWGDHEIQTNLFGNSDVQSGRQACVGASPGIDAGGGGAAARGCRGGWRLGGGCVGGPAAARGCRDGWTVVWIFEFRVPKLLFFEIRISGTEKSVLFADLQQKS